MQYRILGPLEVAPDGQPATLKGKKPRALLALLLLSANESVPAEHLVDGLWGDKAPATAAEHAPGLRLAAAEARRRPPRRPAARGYSLRVEPDELDAERFERLAAEAAAALGRSAYGEAFELAEEALALWRGPALADVHYESFAQPAILRLEELRLAAIENRIEAELGLGRHDQAIGELEALVAEQPGAGAPPRAAHARALPGRAAGRRARDVPGGTSGAPRRARARAWPGAPRARAGDPPPGRRRSPGGRCQRATSPFRSARSSGGTASWRRSAQLCRRGEARLLTLTGPGGAGKTRLGIEAANALAGELPDGAFFVPLDAIRDPALILPAIAHALAVRESGRAAAAREPRRAPRRPPRPHAARQLRAARRVGPSPDRSAGGDCRA